MNLHRRITTINFEAGVLRRIDAYVRDFSVDDLAWLRPRKSSRSAFVNKAVKEFLDRRTKIGSIIKDGKRYPVYEEV